ncbi:MAG: hypothetical protein SFT92_09495 [Rickettsiales bacterium]|nr:hypothetical protein [Rickettsiales bacterium]
MDKLVNFILAILELFLFGFELGLVEHLVHEQVEQLIQLLFDLGVFFLERCGLAAMEDFLLCIRGANVIQQRDERFRVSDSQRCQSFLRLGDHILLAYPHFLFGFFRVVDSKIRP